MGAREDCHYLGAITSASGHSAHSNLALVWSAAAGLLSHTGTGRTGRSVLRTYLHIGFIGCGSGQTPTSIMYEHNVAQLRLRVVHTFNQQPGPFGQSVRQPTSIAADVVQTCFQHGYQHGFQRGVDVEVAVAGRRPVDPHVA